MTETPKRRFRRKQLEVEIKIRDESGEGEILFDTHDLSLGGAFLKSELLLEEGETLELEVHFGARETTVPIRARVVRSTRQSDSRSGPGMGIEFIDLSTEASEAILAFLVEQRA